MGYQEKRGKQPQRVTSHYDDEILFPQKGCCEDPAPGPVANAAGLV